MNKYKKAINSFNFIFMIFLMSNFVFSVCSVEPEFIKVKSGNFDLGNVEPNSLVFVKPKLSSNPITLDFVFENIEQSCYTDSSVSVQLIKDYSQFQTGGKSIETYEGGERTTFSFVLNPSFSITSTLTTKYKITTSSGNGEGSLIFRDDSTIPSLSISGIDTSEIVKSGDEINFNYLVSDSDSGLSRILITGGSKSFLYDYIEAEKNGESNFPTFYNDTPKSDKTYTVRVEDRLGNFNQEKIEIKVDSKAPVIKEIKKHYEYSSNKRLVSFSVIVEDESFEDDLMPVVTGDFSKVNSNLVEHTSVCSKNSLSEKQYVCMFSEFEITQLDKTSGVSITFTVSDSVGNTKDISKTEEIFIDNTQPVINEFNVVNSLGVKNKVSIFDSNITVRLVATDDSLVEPELIIEDFDEIQFAGSNRVCESNSQTNKLTCEWKIGNTIQAYSGFNDLESAVFKVLVIDKYGNSAQRDVTIQFDSNSPQLAKEIELRKNNDIKTGVLQSQEVIDFRVTIDDENILTEDGYNFVFGDFSSINYDDEFKKKEGRCYNQANVAICEFLGIKLNNGYYKENVTIYVSDITGNKNKFNYEVEVFAISDENEQYFDIDDLYILNPISRERMVDESVKIWFEGDIKTSDSGISKNIEIINYQYVGCNESELEPFSLIPGYDKLFPSSIVYVNPETKEEDSRFAFKMELKNHPALGDLNKKDVTCQMSILKRDLENVYPEEIVDFKLTIDFFNSKSGGLTQAMAKELIENVNDADVLGETFDDVYEVYEMVSSVCSVVSSATGVMSGVSSAWQAVSVILHGTVYGKAPALLGDNAIFGADGFLSTLNSGGTVSEFCSYVTCKNGGLITGFGGSTGLGEWLDDVNNYVGEACTFGFEGEDEESEGSEEGEVTGESNNEEGTEAGDSETSTQQYVPVLDEAGVDINKAYESGDVLPNGNIIGSVDENGKPISVISPVELPDLDFEVTTIDDNTEGGNN